MRDQTITCTDCGRKFIWTVGEQKYFREHNLSRPKRCEDCLKRKKEQRNRNGRRFSREQWQDIHVSSALFELFAMVVASVIIAFFFGTIPAIAVLLGVNAVVFVSYGYDKLAAKAKWARIPEDILILIAVPFGWLGAQLGRVVFHHKTRDPKFRAKYWAVFVTEIVFALIILSVLVQRR